MSAKCTRCLIGGANCSTRHVLRAHRGRSQKDPFAGRRWCSASAQAAAELGSTGSLPAGASASLMMGRARLSPGAVVLQSNSVFNRLRGGHASGAQLVEGLRQLAAVGRDASPDDLEALSARPPFRQLLEDLLQQLPRDTGENTGWGQGWTAQVVESLRELRVRDVDPRLGVRLGHTLVQNASDPEVPLEALCHAVCDLGAAETRGLAPDSYATWVLGEKLRELCQAELGELKMDRLVPLLHLFAHPSLRDQISARWSQTVLAHVEHGLPECGVSDVAKLLQAYADVPAASAVVSAALRRLLDAQKDVPEGLRNASVPELAAIAESLPRRAADEEEFVVDLAKLILTSLARMLAENGFGERQGGADFEFAAAAIAAAAEALQFRSLEDGPLADALTAFGRLILPGTAAPSSGPSSAVPPSSPNLAAVPADSLAQLLRLGLKQGATASAASSAWPRPLAVSVMPRLGELTSARLAEMASALAATELDTIPADIFGAVQAVVSSRASSITPAEFGTIARAMASASVLGAELLDAFDVEACLVQPVQPDALAAIAWSMAVADAGTEAAWVLVAAQLESAKAEWHNAPAATRGLLFEALAAHRELSSVSWETGSTAAEVLSDDSWRASWLERREKLASSSTQGDVVAGLLEELGADAERNKEGAEGLYLMPFALNGAKIVLDLLSTSARHPASRAFRGESKLRHNVWAACGRSVLAVPDSMWVDLARSQKVEGEEQGTSESAEAKQRQLSWLRRQLENLRRADMVRETELPVDTEAQLADVPFGEGGIGVDGLRALARENEEVRRRAVRSFLATWKDPNFNIKNLTAWLIGTVKKARSDVEKETQLKAELTAAPREKAQLAGQPSKRPAEGWAHEEGKPLEKVQVGERVSGHVTQVLRERVWVNVGFVKDASFKAPSAGVYKIGDEIKNLRVTTVDLENVRVEVTKASAFKEAKRPKQSAEAKRPVTSPSPPASQRAAPSSPAKSQQATAASPSRAQTWRQALSPRPKQGWGHGGGRDIAELRVGEVVEGVVTNVLYKRVWVNIGAANDASFNMDGEGRNPFKVGDKISDLSVQSIDLNQGHVVVQPPSSGKNQEK